MDINSNMNSLNTEGRSVDDFVKQLSDDFVANNLADDTIDDLCDYLGNDSTTPKAGKSFFPTYGNTLSAWLDSPYSSLNAQFPPPQFQDTDISFFFTDKRNSLTTTDDPFDVPLFSPKNYKKEFETKLSEVDGRLETGDGQAEVFTDFKIFQNISDEHNNCVIKRVLDLMSEIVDNPYISKFQNIRKWPFLLFKQCSEEVLYNLLSEEKIDDPLWQLYFGITCIWLQKEPHKNHIDVIQNNLKAMVLKGIGLNEKFRSIGCREICLMFINDNRRLFKNYKKVKVFSTSYDRNRNLLINYEEVKNPSSSEIEKNQGQWKYTTDDSAKSLVSWEDDVQQQDETEPMKWSLGAFVHPKKINSHTGTIQLQPLHSSADVTQSLSTFTLSLMTNKRVAILHHYSVENPNGICKEFLFSAPDPGSQDHPTEPEPHISIESLTDIGNMKDESKGQLVDTLSLIVSRIQAEDFSTLLNNPSRCNIFTIQDTNSPFRKQNTLSSINNHINCITTKVAPITVPYEKRRDITKLIEID